MGAERFLIEEWALNVDSLIDECAPFRMGAER
jgi:hypothetical protein